MPTAGPNDGLFRDLFSLVAHPPTVEDNASELFSFLDSMVLAPEKEKKRKKRKEPRLEPSQEPFAQPKQQSPLPPL